MQSNSQLNINLPVKSDSFKRRLRFVLPILSLLVILIVFWWLKLVGITLAGDAFCGMEEHIHSDACIAYMADDSVVTSASASVSSENAEATAAEATTSEVNSKPVYICGYEEHIHKASCYSDITADLESPEIWEATFADIPDGISTSEKIVAIANSQLGYKESVLNFKVDSDGTRRGYSRYGEWYGNPYGEWSNLFTSFCLRYSGLEDVPVGAKADTLLLKWQEQNIYRPFENYSPTTGDIVFIDTNADGTADTTGIISEITSGSLKVIEGDKNDSVVLSEISLETGEILGYGTTCPQRAPAMMSTGASANTGQKVGITIPYSSSLLSSNTNFIIYALGSDGNYYAIDGNGDAVKLSIDQNGNIYADVSDTSSLYWTFSYCGSYDSRTTYYIQNVATKQYLHPFINSNTDKDAVLSGRWESAIYPSSDGVKIRGARQNAYAQLQNNASFTAANPIASGSVLYFGRTLPTYTVWLDGTNGGIMSLGGSPNSSYTITEGSQMTLPTQWQSPDKYSYTLRGWYDIVNHKYYAPGSQVTVTQNMVFYADWQASTYDIGQYNSQTADTVSTNNFVTTRMFDYGVLFNLLSENVSTNISASEHTETRSLLTSGNNPYNSNSTLGFIFRDWDRGNEDISYPANHSQNLRLSRRLE